MPVKIFPYLHQFKNTNFSRAGECECAFLNGVEAKGRKYVDGGMLCAGELCYGGALRIKNRCEICWEIKGGSFATAIYSAADFLLVV